MLEHQDGQDVLLTEVVDLPAVQSLLEEFYAVAGIPFAIIDLSGEVLAGAGWQEICTKFHRVHPDTRRGCIESDTQLSSGLRAGEFRVYRCKNNMWDVATPIVVDGRHVANLFSGQFFFDDEPLEYDVFRKQARRYGFDENGYIAALEAVPRLRRERVESAVRFFTRLAGMLSEAGRSNLALARAAREREALVTSLRWSEADLARAQAVSRTGSWRLDVKANRLTWSDEAHRLFRVPRGTALTYETFLERVHPDDRLRVDEAWKAAMAGAPYDIEHRIVVDGEVKWVRERAELEVDSSGGLLGGFGTVQDITELRHAQDALRAQAERLADANRMKDEFLATLSHELRTPLNAILGWSHLLAEGMVASDDLRKAASRIERNAWSQARLIEDVLDMSRIVTGRLCLEAQPTDIRDVIAAAIESVAGAAAAKRIELVADVPAGTMLTADPARLQQVFWNLLSNAVKFTDDGGRVDVSMEVARGQVVVRVKDTGIGIPADFMPFLFQRFRQRDSSSSRRYGGLGLGLATVRHLVELHGGTVTASSEGENQGATFEVRLPIR
ncbi:MAG: PocR ligand-binding domain-containing protein [Vicinamibacterales bacterium]